MQLRAQIRQTNCANFEGHRVSWMMVCVFFSRKSCCTLSPIRNYARFRVPEGRTNMGKRAHKIMCEMAIVPKSLCQMQSAMGTTNNILSKYSLNKIYKSLFYWGIFSIKIFLVKHAYIITIDKRFLFLQYSFKQSNRLYLLE